MAVLATAGITLPKNIAEGMWKKAQTGSAIAALANSVPQKFGEETIVTLTGRPRAELVAEGADKGDTNATFGTKIATPHKFQVTMRFNQEVQWADEAYQLGILTTLAQEGGEALSRALDLGGFHGINPRAGTAAASIVAGDRIATTTNSVEITTATLTTPDLVIEQAAGLVIADGYIPNGIAFDPTYSWTVATSRYADGRKKYPELGFGQNVTSFEGLPAFSSTTVSGLPEASADSNVKAIVGQWDAFRWGVQENIPVELIKYGDPDGLGDLKRKNQIALRLEVVYAWAVMDLNAFATVKDAVTNV
jgi:HK97 family phage major capsid protein